MRLAPRNRRRQTLLLELTPMVDVVFLLIIFFMVTSEFARDARAELDLPELPGEQSEVQEEAGLVVNITAAGEILLSTSEDAVGLESLERRMRQYLAEADGSRVTLRADRGTSIAVFNSVVRVMDEVGVSHARIATEVPH